MCLDGSKDTTAPWPGPLSAVTTWQQPVQREQSCLSLSQVYSNKVAGKFEAQIFKIYRVLPFFSI